MAKERNGLSRQLRRTIRLLVVAFVVFYLVVPQLAGARKALSVLSSVNVLLLVAGVVLAALAMVSYAFLGRALLPREHAPSVGTLLRIQLATKAVTNVVPGGSAAGSALGYKLLRETGIPTADATFVVAMQSVGSAVVLNALLWLGLVVAIPLRGLHPLFGTAALVGIVLFAGFGTAVLMLTRGEERAVSALRSVSRRIPFLAEDAVEVMVRRVAGRLRELARDPALLARGVAWAALNWLLDAASLWVFLEAFGHRAGVDALIVSYGLAYVLAAVPITPGGLGVVEAVLTTTLVGFGAERAVAILGVIAYRLVNFWLPIPLGAVSYLSLQFVTREERERRAERLRRLAEDAFASAEDPRGWAVRHGVRIRPSEHDDGEPRDQEPDRRAAGGGAS